MSNAKGNVGYTWLGSLLQQMLLQVKDGTIYEGILHKMRPENEDLNVVLHWARALRGPSAATATPAVKQMLIPSADLVQILAKNVDLSEEELSGPLNGGNAFETDSEISKGRGGCDPCSILGPL